MQNVKIKMQNGKQKFMNRDSYNGPTTLRRHFPF